MSETTAKINKLAIQHKVIYTKTDCPFFNPTGNSCLRVKNGRLRCDEYLECEFKYIDVLKEENKRLQAENDELKHKNEILLGQLVINDGEDVTVQISQSQFNEYNELKAENERLNSLRLQLQSSELKQHLEKVNCERENFKLRKAFEEIREIAKEIDDVDKWIEQDLMPTQVCERIEKINNKISEVLK